MNFGFTFTNRFNKRFANRSMFLKIASILIISVAFVSCSSKQKKPQTTTPATPAAKQEATKTATPTAAANTKAVTCKNGSDTRTISVAAKDGGCEVSYTKFGQTTAPASSSKGDAHCISVVEKIKGNLENAGFKCE